MEAAVPTTNNEEELADELIRSPLVSSLPACLVSCIVHLAAVLVLALVTLPAHVPAIGTFLEGIAVAADEAALFQPTEFTSVDLQKTELISTSVGADLASVSVGDDFVMRDLSNFQACTRLSASSASAVTKNPNRKKVTAMTIGIVSRRRFLITTSITASAPRCADRRR